MRMNDGTTSLVMEQIEDVIGRNVGRDIGRMVTFAKGGVERAARSITAASKPHVGIVTGFFIRHAEPPSPETDGLGGAAHLAAGLLNAGIPTTLISDAPCAKAVWALSTAIPGAVDLEIVSTQERCRISAAGQALPGGAANYSSHCHRTCGTGRRR